MTDNFNIILEYSLDDFTSEVIHALSKGIGESDYVLPITFDHETQKIWIIEAIQKSKIDNNIFFEFIDTNPNSDKIIKTLQEVMLESKNG